MVTENKLFRIIVYVIMSILSLACVLPILLLFMASITDEQALVANGYSFFPETFSVYAYEYIFKASSTIIRAYGITFFITFVGTTVNILLTLLIAYPLSRRSLKGRNKISFLIFFTMMFNGGLVPSYMMWTQTFHIRDTIFALLVPNLMLNAFNIIMMRNYFSNNIPDSLIEAAQIDGATELKILFKVALPLSTPIIATVGLMAGLAYWNDWMNGLYYLFKKTDLYSIQNVLNTMINNIQFLQSQAASQGSEFTSGSLPSTGIRMAIAVIAIIPIMAIYPFVQKAFVKGIIVGGVKG